MKAFIERSTVDNEQELSSSAEIWMEHLDGKVVLEGTAGIGAETETEVDRQLARIKPVDGALAFIPYPVGTKTTCVEKVKLSFGKEIGPLFPFMLEKKLECITEYHPWFDPEQVRGYFLVFVQLAEKYGTLIERYTALIEKV
eukprot:SAG31_NODE_8968_length_1355_cov_1.694268_2_plen_141_part_01